MKLTKRLLISFSPFIIFTTIMLLFNPYSIYVSELGRMKWWIILLNTLFALQYNLAYEIKHSPNDATISGTTSSISMAACCTQHIIEFFPLLGASLITSFVVSIQNELFLLALIINCVGFLRIIKSVESLKHSSVLLSLIQRIKYRYWKYISLVLILSAFILIQ